MKNRKSAGFGLVELMLSVGLGAIVSAALIELMGMFWQHSLLLRENMYVQRQGHTAVQLLRASLRRAGAGVCVPNSPIPAIYGSENGARHALWVGYASDKERANIVAHHTETRTFVIDSNRVFKRGTTILLADAHCAHAALASIQYRNGRSYGYIPVHQSWYTEHHRTQQPVQPINFHASHLSRWLIRGYHVNTNDTNPALYQSVGFHQSAKQILLANVSSLRCHYGVDLDVVADGIPNQYLHASGIDAIDGWSRVRNIRISLDTRARTRTHHAQDNEPDYMRANFWLQHAM